MNYELNMKDPEINNDIINLINKHKNIPEFFKYKYNSIFGKKFYGVFQIKCDKCGQIIEYEEFNHINIDIEQYCKNNLDNALVYFYFDDLIEYYFKNENCNKKIKIEKKIIRFPDIFIFAIKWENFIPKYGFYFGGEPLEENKLIFDEIIDLTNYSFINENKNKNKYKIRSIINYGIINDNNEDDSSWHKFITFNRNLIDDKFYSCQPSATIDKINRINRKKFVPSVLFYERI